MSNRLFYSAKNNTQKKVKRSSPSFNKLAIALFFINTSYDVSCVSLACKKRQVGGHKNLKCAVFHRFCLLDLDHAGNKIYS